MSDPDLLVGVISPNEKFNNLAKSLAHELNHHLKIKIAKAEYAQALVIGEQMEKDGIEVIIARHGTALLLSQNLNIPVLSVPYGSLQILKCMPKAAALGSRILIPLYDEHIEGIPELQKIFNVEIISLNRYDFDSAKGLLTKGKELGCNVLLGGHSTSTQAREMGYQALEVPLNRGTIISTIKNAISVAESRLKEREHNLLNQKIIESSDDGIITVDRNGNINSFNSVAESILDAKGKNVSGKNISQLLPETKIGLAWLQGEKISNRIETINNNAYLLNYVPVYEKSNLVAGIINIQKPSNVQTAEQEIRRSLTKRFVAKYTIDNFINQGRKSRELVERTKRYSVYDSTVLIIGPTGTGKEIIAQSIHNLSRRKNGPFVSINCASLPKNLLESELFGYDEGAFTGSRRGGKAGLFELAHGGTIFLDEIDSSPVTLQPLLLRVIQEKEVMRIGGNRLIPVDVRIIAASGKSLDQRVIEGEFREDLYFRINILSLNIAPLRERLEDLPLLVEYLIKEKSRKNFLPLIDMSEKCLDRLSRLPWTGNVRELSNFIEKLVILSEGEFSSDVFEELYDELVNYNLKTKAYDFETENKFQVIVEDEIQQKESVKIKKALIDCNFNKKSAARQLGISRTTLWRKIKELSIL